MSAADFAASGHRQGAGAGSIALWTIAAMLAGGVHLGIGVWLLRQPAPPLVQEAGTTAIEIDLAALGFAEADASLAGEMVEPSEAVPAEPVDAAQPVESAEREVAEPVQPMEREASEPVESEPALTEPTQPVEPQEAAPEAPTPVTEADAVEPVEPLALPVAETSSAVEPVEPVAPQAAPSPIEEATPAEPVETSRQAEAIADVPIPTPRPNYTPPPEPRRQETVEQRPPTEPAAGNRGRSQAEARRGTAEGSTGGQAAAETQGNRTRNDGAASAAVSNYPGEVAARLRRALRYPREAQRQRLRGEVHVSFTVDSSGGVGGIRVVRSSGHPVLDQAAIATVQRAAPFPPTPDGRASWPFTVPLAFSR